MTYLCPNHHAHSNLLDALSELLTALRLLHDGAVPIVHTVSLEYIDWARKILLEIRFQEANESTVGQ